MIICCFSASKGANPYECRVDPFPHGLDLAFKHQAKSIVLVPSILDSVILSGKSGPTGHIFPVALSEGTSTLPPDHLPFLEPYKVTFWFSDNTSSFEATRIFAKKIGETKCRAMSRDLAQPSVWIKTFPQKQELDAAFVKLNSKECSHEYITTFDRLRDDIYVEFLTANDVKGVPWKRFSGNY